MGPAEVLRPLRTSRVAGRLHPCCTSSQGPRSSEGSSASQSDHSIVFGAPALPRAPEAVPPSAPVPGPAGLMQRAVRTMGAGQACLSASRTGRPSAGTTTSIRPSPPRPRRPRRLQEQKLRQCPVASQFRTVPCGDAGGRGRRLHLRDDEGYGCLAKPILLCFVAFPSPSRPSLGGVRAGAREVCGGTGTRKLVRRAQRTPEAVVPR